MFEKDVVRERRTVGRHLHIGKERFDTVGASEKTRSDDNKIGWVEYSQ